MNVFTFSGNLGRDCKAGNVSGTTVVNFAVAAKSGYGQNEQTIWVDCALWGKRGDSLQQYLTKGQQVVVSGELGTREHEGKTYLTCRVSELSLVGGKPQGQSAPQPKPQPKPKQSEPEFDDDIPF